MHWMPTIQKHKTRGAAEKQTSERTTHWKSEDRNVPITAEHSAL